MARREIITPIDTVTMHAPLRAFPAAQEYIPNRKVGFRGGLSFSIRKDSGHVRVSYDQPSKGSNASLAYEKMAGSSNDIPMDFDMDESLSMELTVIALTAIWYMWFNCCVNSLEGYLNLKEYLKFYNGQKDSVQIVSEQRDDNDMIEVDADTTSPNMACLLRFRNCSDMINFDADVTLQNVQGFRDFDEIFKNVLQPQSLLDIFPNQQIGSDRVVETETESQDILSMGVPNEQLPKPLSPARVKPPVVDLLTGQPLNVKWPIGTMLIPKKYLPDPPVGILITFDDELDEPFETKPLTTKEYEEIFALLFAESESPQSQSPTEKSRSTTPLDESKTSVEKIQDVSLPKKKKKTRGKRRRSQSLKQEVSKFEGNKEILKIISKETSPEIDIPEEISQSTSSPEITTSMIPKRREVFKAGECGINTQVLVNMLSINIGDNLPKQIEHYRVCFEPSEPKRLIYKAYEAAKEQLFPSINPAYNGRNDLYSAVCLPFDLPARILIKVPDNSADSTETKVLVTFTKHEKKDNNVLDLHWMKDIHTKTLNKRNEAACVSALHNIMKSVALKNSIHVRGRCIISPKDETMDIDNSLTVWCGLFRSIVIGWKPFLKVNGKASHKILSPCIVLTTVLHKVLHKRMNVIDFIKCIIAENSYECHERIITHDDVKSHLKSLNNRLNGINVTISCNGEERHQQLISSVTDKRPHELVFQAEQGDMSVKEYFLLNKGYTIEYPDLPCLCINNQGKNTYIPMELCTIEEDQPRHSTNLCRNKRKKLFQIVNTNANERRNKIYNMLRAFDVTNNPCLESFGLSVNPEFEKVEARVLDPPSLYSHQNAEVKPKDGVWDIERCLYPTARLAHPGSWIVLDLSDTSPEIIWQFAQLFEIEARELGLPIGTPRVPFMTLTVNERAYLSANLRMCQQLGVVLVIVVLPEDDYNKNFYCAVKQEAELNVGIMTQCIRSSTIRRNATKDTMRNLLLKINVKLLGVNSSFASGIYRPKYLKEPCIILGADVTHPASYKEPSIAALVASFDPNTYAQYSVEYRFQPPNAEIMHDLEEMMKAQLLNFYRRSGYKPVKIIYYRDGVSDTQFETVLNQEMLAIRRACTSLDEKYQPPITFMVLQKRHHTSFFPVSDENAGDWLYNVKVGTVVDTVITHPTDIDFFLVSNASLTGLKKATRYRCLWDDSNFSIDELQQLTYYLCHIYACSQQSITYAAPTYYAHKAAARARSLVKGVNINLDDLKNEQLKKLTIHPNLVLYSPMYFI